MARWRVIEGRPAWPDARAVLRALTAHAWVLTLVLGSAVILLGVRGPDLPAQDFRTWVARNAGMVAFNNLWYDGHSLPGYSVIFPPTAALIGARTTGLLACAFTTWAACRLVARVAGTEMDAAQRFFRWALAIVIVGELVIGQLPFALGLALGMGALLAVAAGRHWALVLLLAAGSSLSSPLAGLFLLLAGVAWAPQTRLRSVLPLAAAGTGMLVSAATGGGGGRFPFTPADLAGVLILTAVTVAATPRSSKVVRRFALLYAAAGALLFLIPNPVGANFVRLERTLALPAVGYLVIRYRPRSRVLGVAMVPLVGWQFLPVATAVANSVGDPSAKASYYAGIQAFLARQDPAAGRLEVPFTREHWESVFLAQRFPLARGWERQLDLQYSPMLYHPLNAGTYRRWLDDNAVSLVALPDVPLDSGGESEGDLLQQPPGYLTEVWHDEHWRVWRVSDAVPLATGPATLTKLGISSFTLDFRQPGTETVRIRASSMWAVDGPAGACLTSTREGWVQVRADTPGELRVSARVGNILSRDNDDC